MTKDDQSELFVIVDEDDNILGYRTRADCHNDKKLIHRAIGVVIFNDKGEILLQKRSMNKDTSPGMYEISVSGHVAKNESYEAAALREMQEEIGIGTEVTFVTKYLNHLPNETEFDALFRATHNGPFAINKDEVDEVVFATEEDIRDNLYDLTIFAKRALQVVGVV